MKKFVFYAAVMLFFAACSKDEEGGMPSLPDPNDVCSAMDDIQFMEYCYTNFDVNDDGKVSKTEARAVQKMEIYGDIKSLKGIEFFSNLTELDCDCSLTSLDISKNQKLILLDCSDNQLTSLDLSKNTALETVMCDENKLTSININSGLKELWCHDNLLTSLNVSKGVDLITLSCDYNKLTSLDISKNTVLTRLDCRANELTSLDISKNTALKVLNCYRNKLTSLDISKNTALESFACTKNPGDGTTFSVKAWFDNNNVPRNFTSKMWLDDETDRYITIHYYK